MEIDYEPTLEIKAMLDRINETKNGVALLGMLREIQHLPADYAGTTLASGKDRRLRVLAGPREACTHFLFRRLIALEGNNQARDMFCRWLGVLAWDEMLDFMHYCDGVLDLESSIAISQRKKGKSN